MSATIDEVDKARDVHFVGPVSMIVKWALGFFGLGGILYGCGFLALRSEASFLGIWGGATSDAATVADEGGRFFYNILFVLASPFASFNRRTTVFLLIVAIFWASRAIVGRFITPFEVRERSQTWFAWLPSVSVGCSALLVTGVLLAKMWKIVGYHDVLRNLTLPSYLVSAESRYETYEELLFRLLVSASLGWLLLRTVWYKGGIPERLLVAAQLLLVCAAILSLPFMHGRLVLTHSFPSFTYTGATNDRLLLGQSTDTWVVWNVSRKVTEVIRKSQEPLVTIGHREPLLK